MAQNYDISVCVSIMLSGSILLCLQMYEWDLLRYFSLDQSGEQTEQKTEKTNMGVHVWWGSESLKAAIDTETACWITR